MRKKQVILLLHLSQAMKKCFDLFSYLPGLVMEDIMSAVKLAEYVFFLFQCKKTPLPVYKLDGERAFSLQKKKGPEFSGPQVINDYVVGFQNEMWNPFPYPIFS